ncbi:imidazolonepropionase-like amidohydrolase [Marmoricola sp. URHA0025 HA25]
MHAEMQALRAPVAFDGTRFIPGGVTVIIDADTIFAVESYDHPVPVACPVTTYDGTLLPGLFDAHVHLVSDAGRGSLERAATMTDEELDSVITQSLRQQALAGVTTVRDLGDTGFRTLTHRDRAAAGMPRIVAAGPPITVPDGHCHYLGCVAEGPEAVRTAVLGHAERGVDVIKVMAGGGMTTGGSDVFGVQFAADELRLLVDTAHDLGLGVLAHAHSLAGIEHALDAGVDGIEHFTGISPDGIRLPDELLDRVAAAGVAVDPTLGSDATQFAPSEGPPPRIVEELARIGVDLPTLLARRRIDAGRMRDHGVRVVSGVDAGAAPLKPHGNAWRAVADLVSAGYPVDEALATATSVAADACGLREVTGALREGLSADLLVVDGDLRSDVDALHHPVAVLVCGADALA